jgi:chromosome segregation ATPase
MTIEQDFETMRNGPVILAPVQLAALSRIEAEIERLEVDRRNVRKDMDAAVELLNAEVERLRTKYTDLSIGLTEKGAENKRLRERVRLAEEGEHVQELEGERLRAEAAQRWEQHTHLRETELEIENKRLRDALTSANDDYADSKAEVERLRANLKTTVENRDAWLAEAERLREALKETYAKSDRRGAAIE